MGKKWFILLFFNINILYILVRVFFLIVFFNRYKEREIVLVKLLKWNFCNDVFFGKDINIKFVVFMNFVEIKREFEYVIVLFILFSLSLDIE